MHRPFAVPARIARIAGSTVGIAAVALAAITLAPAAHADSVSPPASIDATGATDVTAALDDWIAGTPDRSTITLAADARYRVDGVIQIRNRRGLVIEGNGATIVAPDDGSSSEPTQRSLAGKWPRNRRHVAISGSTDITVRDLAIDGPDTDGAYDPALEGQAGFVIGGSTDVTLERVDVREVWGDGVYIGGGSEAVRIVDSTFDLIGRQGVAIVNGVDVVVERNRFDRVARSVFDVEPVRRWKVERVTLRDNAVGDYGNFLLASGGGGENVTDLRLEGNEIDGGRGLTVFAGVARSPRRGLAIVGNSSDVVGNPAEGTSAIRIVNYADVEIRDNRGRVEPDAIAITLNAVCEVVIDGNEWRDASAESRETAACGETPDTERPGADGSGTGDTDDTDRASDGTSAGSAGRAAPSASEVPVWLYGVAGGVLVLLVIVEAARFRRRRRRAARERGGDPPRDQTR